MSKLGELVLRSLSRPLVTTDYVAGDQHWEVRDPLETLKEIFPNFLNEIAGKSVIDLGCGAGYQAIAMAQNGARKVLGCDIRPELQEESREALQKMGGVPTGILEFSRAMSAKEDYDLLTSLDCMEHVEDPMATLYSIYAALKPGGKALISFGPPWYAPYGPHMHFFTKVPWVHLIFSEKTVLNVRQLYRLDSPAKTYREAGLGKLSIAKWERTLEKQPWFTVESNNYTTVRDLPLVGRIPIARELLINNVATVLRKST
jgi:2-polyprenyl-3-methyl-5-hydroxy-6-metoxy-1,4-benzoquinol methylase